ncbi:sulfite exporter TauE/SafE family protein [Phyllobacterium sp. 0TCS1.6C]|uniref:sulfite exporter TauE/SafE family protein n=2 Tax=unclassified Phyllobacterium TaxID=2638441 RepID=UPI002263DE87|nr:sulfite exporter TauE/SafE family protein [Phyllobacterium sp. 0TCS1.6C]MCX8279333.1 sulfite exporter TauE/SafE family protein [Phyllobacterium sp. 0TCS1.6C]MCX8294117.1 sulfite exporter TauE/SafE family protein [Phyllobacterium sp. 0TCS1.6A]
MTINQALAFMVTAGLAAYVQALTGFAFGLILMGAVALGAMMPLQDAAVVTSVLTLVNASMMLSKGWNEVLKKTLVLVLLSSLPSLVIGYLLIEHLAENGVVLMRILLGAIIIVSSLQLVLPPKREKQPASDRSFVTFGIFSGLMSGMFSTSGPPLVYHLYRQPLPLVAIRETLVTIFGVNALLRLGVVIADGTFPDRHYWPAFFAIVPVMAGTQLARRLPLPISGKHLKLIIFVLLCASGASLAIPGLAAALQLLGS